MKLNSNDKKKFHKVQFEMGFKYKIYNWIQDYEKNVFSSINKQRI